MVPSASSDDRDPDRVIDPRTRTDDESELSIRPRRLTEMIGQIRVKENLKIAIQAARSRAETLDHVLLYGPPGLGKTTLSNIIANEMDAPIRADNVSAGLSHQGQQTRGSGAEVNGRDAFPPQSLKNPAAVGKHIILVVRGAQASDP